MTIRQIGELLQRFVKNGVVRGNDTLTIRDYQNIAILARDYILFDKKRATNSMVFLQMDVSKENQYKIVGEYAELPSGFNVQGISSVTLMTEAKNPLDATLLPVSGAQMNIVTDGLFSYYAPLSNKLKFKNIPQNAYYANVVSLAGTDPDDEVTNDVAFIIFKECMKLGQMSEEKRKDTTADGNKFDDYLQNQIRQFINAPNNIA